MVPFIQELSYSGKYDMLSAIHRDQMHHPWRTFVAIINRCICRKSIGLYRLRPSRAQILWGMFNQKNVDYVALLCEDFMFQADNREISSARKENMPYPRFTKVIISRFISKDKTISMRNRIILHIVHDDSLMDIKDSKAYKTCLDSATGKATPKKARKFKKFSSPSKKLSPVLEEEEEPAKKPKRAKKTCQEVYYYANNSKQKTYKLYASGSGDGVGSHPKVPDKQHNKTTGINEGTRTIPRVPDVPKKMTDAVRDDVSQENSFEQVEDDAHVTLIAAHVTQKTDGPMQSSSVSSDFSS
ncbi:hypothetical protein Tco_0877228 [Tanacetum coccineum]|uniref:Uncharacterized protein n=1 Tax=Tanacetum coccineum TaxID=301880 RepID=A0ABQ5BXJ5_9ASTR